MRRRLVIPTALLFVGLGVACDDETPVGPQTIDHGAEGAASVTVQPATATLKVGETIQLTGTTVCGHGLESQRPITWRSGDDVMALVDQTGLVTAMAPGVVEITAWSDGKTATASIAVSAIAKKAASIVVHPEGPFVLEPGQTLQLTAMPYDEAGTAQPTWEVTWSSSRDWVAGVATDGMVTTKADGTTFVKAESYGASDEVMVTVTSQPVTPPPPQDRTPPIAQFKAPQTPRTVRPNALGFGIGVFGTITDASVITKAELAFWDSTDGTCSDGNDRLLAVALDMDPKRWPPSNPVDLTNGTNSITVQEEPRILRPGGNFVGPKTYCLTLQVEDSVGNADTLVMAVDVTWK